MISRNVPTPVAASAQAALGCELLTPEDVADLLKVSKRTVFRMRAAGLRPPPVELTTNLILWRAEAIHRFVRDLRERKVRSRPGLRGA